MTEEEVEKRSDTDIFQLVDHLFDCIVSSCHLVSLIHSFEIRVVMVESMFQTDVCRSHRRRGSKGSTEFQGERRVEKVFSEVILTSEDRSSGRVLPCPGGQDEHPRSHK